MLSYRHAFHAGNSADVLKHIVLIQVLSYLRQKDKPFDYIDTHSGAGYYALDSSIANKTSEYLDGIGRLWQAESLSPVLQSFIAVIHALVGDNQRYYPGSPAIASHFLSAVDKGWLFELHSSDVQRLEQSFRQRHIFVRHQDGFQGLLGLLPPVSRRSCVLIDPSYEIKRDYEQVIQVLEKAYRRFATGIYLLWYPLVERERVNRMEKQLKQSGVKCIDRYELSTRADSVGHGMTGSGLFVINPPWTLRTTMETVLPELVNLLGEDSGAGYRNDIVVSE